MPRLADRRSTFFVALMAMSLAGCAPEMAGLRQSLAHPGPAAYQRQQAIHHDPYVLNDVGPEVVGGRPRGYMTPLSEVERARLDAPVPPGIRPPAPAAAVVVGSAPGPAPTYVTPPAPGAPPYPPAGPPIVTTPAPPAPSYPVQQRPPY